MSWRIAKSLTVLLNEVNDLAPARRRASDGSIGDAAHASRSSDHNPWVRDGDTGVVTARDITHDPANGCDAGKLAEHFRALGKTGDRRVKYVIWNRRIASSTGDWSWRPYDGPNPHTKHVHLSVSTEKRHYDSSKPWGLKPKPQPAPTPEPAAPLDPLEDLMAASDADRRKFMTELVDAFLSRDIQLGPAAARELGVATASVAQLLQAGPAIATDVRQAVSALEATLRGLPEEVRALVNPSVRVL